MFLVTKRMAQGPFLMISGTAARRIPDIDPLTRTVNVQKSAKTARSSGSWVNHRLSPTNLHHDEGRHTDGRSITRISMSLTLRAPA